MSTLYRKVLCSDRLPNCGDCYLTSVGECYLDKKNCWICELDGIIPEWWFEEVTIPDEEYVENFIIELQKHFKMKFDVETWKSGFKVALELLTGGK